MNKEVELLEKIKRLRTIAQIGLVYSTDEYNIERYTELLEISNSLTSVVSDVDLAELSGCFRVESDYVTPKVDIRAVIFNDRDEILLVKERADGKWSLPGGWADVGYSPSEVAVKEVLEETGLKVRPQRLLAVIDQRCHPYPHSLRYVYKLFIRCEILEGELNNGFDILDVGFFKQDELPVLSEERVIKKHIDLMFEYKKNPAKDISFD